MAQSAWNVSLPICTLGSSCVDSFSTTPQGVCDISDAVSVSGFVNGTTTAPGLIIQIAFTSDTGATFVNYTYPSSAMGLVNVTSAYFTLPLIGGKQMQISSTVSTRATPASMLWTKQVYL